MSDIPSTHPRAQSLERRHRLVEGIRSGLTSEAGLIAHGRGEAFDYLLGEHTWPFAKQAIAAASASLLLAKHPVFSLNGNVAALAAPDVVRLQEQLPNMGIEVNIFHYSQQRAMKIRDYMVSLGAKTVLLAEPGSRLELAGIQSERRHMHAEGIAKADVVFVPLEDGDRCEALVVSGRQVVTVDLNPMSRTSSRANITIVDELTRVLPVLCQQIAVDRSIESGLLQKRLAKYDNASIRRSAESCLRQNFNKI